MYKVTCDGNTIYNPIGNYLIPKNLLSAVVTTEANKAGAFEFTIDKEHSYYDAFRPMKDIIEVFEDDEIIFRGRILNTKKDFYSRKTLYCEGIFAALNDSVARPRQLPSTKGAYLQDLLECVHNPQVENCKKLYLGDISDDTGLLNSLLEIKNEKYQSSMNEFLTQFPTNCSSGYVIPRYVYENEKQKTYIDYAAFGTETSRQGYQKIEFGKNLLNFDDFIDFAAIYTIILPLGKTQDSDNTFVTLSGAISNNEDFSIQGETIECNSAVSAFGRITKPIEFKSISSESQLYTEAIKTLKRNIKSSTTINLTAIDMAKLGVETRYIRAGYSYPVISQPHNVNSLFLCTKKTYNLLNPAADTATFGLPLKGLTEMIL